MKFKKTKNEFKKKKSYRWRRNVSIGILLLIISGIAGVISQYG